MSDPSAGTDDRRDSVPEDPDVTSDPKRLAELEAANGLRQFDVGKTIAQTALERIEQGQNFRLRLSLIFDLHREALRGISRYAGNFRPGNVTINKSRHTPPPPHLVAALVEDMCNYVNENWDSATPIHLSAYVMWRLNWIHPFADGNGRTSRITSYVVLEIKAGFLLPGSPSIPDQIVINKNAYFAALDAADAVCAEGKIDVSQMEGLLAGMLATQLAAFYRAAGGKLPGPAQGHTD